MHNLFSFYAIKKISKPDMHENAHAQKISSCSKQYLTPHGFLQNGTTAFHQVLSRGEGPALAIICVCIYIYIYIEKE